MQAQEKMPGGEVLTGAQAVGQLGIRHLVSYRPRRLAGRPNYAKTGDVARLSTRSTLSDI